MAESPEAEKLNEVRAEYESTVVRQLNEEFRKRLTRGDRVADKVAKFGGSWVFISIFALFLVSWMAWNVLKRTMAPDPYPFILLNLILSCLAAIQAPVIMMAQNRAEEREHLEAETDYAINARSEQEVADMQQDLHHMRRELDSLLRVNAELKRLMEEVSKLVAAPGK